MPVSLSRIKKLGTPRMDLPPGDYPAHIVAMVYPKEQDGSCRKTYGEYVLQVHKGAGVCYIATKPFDISISEESHLYTLLAGLTGSNNPEQLYDWLEEHEYFVNDMFDECDFLGVPVMAHVERKNRMNDQSVPYNIVTGFSPIPDELEPELNTARLIPYGFARPNRYEIVKLDELDIDS